ncbi:hypothetical protein [Deinococcus multiflagellatus]|uniref:DUF3108 domain-containing protein n=1 Tax=Deinococcus multiflagellatus TaxID=1656887 RepID=A0ABW1ZGT2_9DEIO|nr:hypothetical protein [Deinococcus multiflagellatus]MBZ9712231.1 hypothetical protein [Deinococcus multiflagellatus]
MKRIASVLLLSLWSSAFAQTKLPCSQTTYFKIIDGIFYGSILDVTAEAYIYVPAKFPNPAEYKEFGQPYTMTCSGFKATSKMGTFTLTGNVQQNFQRLISYWREGHPDRTNYVPGKIDLAFEGDFVYESIREDWYQDRLALQLKNGKLVISYEPYAGVLRDVVVGYRINGAALKPAFFEGKISPIPHDQNDIVELYVKGQHAQFSYIKVDFKNKGITIKHNTPFPAK